MVRRTSSVVDGARTLRVSSASKWAVALTALALTATTGLADAQPPAPGQGVANARKAGIKVDTAAARLMQRAPVGSCFNDPTQATCPQGVTQVVASDVVAEPDGSVGYAMLDEPAVASKKKARASQDDVDATISAVPQCFVRAGYPYYSVGWMWGDGSQNCSLAVTDQELYVALERTTDGVWRQLDTRWTQKYGGGVIRRTAGYNCGHTNQRHYRTVSQGYAVLQGKWYGAENIHDDWRTC